MPDLHTNSPAQMDTGMPFNDALYGWARDGFAKGHASLLGDDT